MLCATTTLYSWWLLLLLLLLLAAMTVFVSGTFVRLQNPGTGGKFQSLFASSSTALSASSVSSSYKPHVPNFCSNCGSGNMTLQVPDGDDHLRAVCQDCSAVVYANPKVVVACVVMVVQSTMSTSASSTSSTTTKVLLAKRAIEPRAGYWGIPQGFMELHDTTTRTAVCREVWEETGVVIAPDQLRLRALYNVPGSVQLVYSVTIASEKDVLLLNEDIAKTTTESSDIGLFALDSLPDLCFPTVQWALDHCCNAANSDKTSKMASSIIQQKNKLYNAESGAWSESEDRDGP
jgi:ADP-ribose pyrophosphatase YjhB (NUDIX family)